jgi:Ser/Thr protein kinase RdoA (MazF antagonist)
VDDAALEDGLLSLGLGDLRKIVGGWQSLAVYEGRADGRRVVVKVLDSRRADRDALGCRLNLLTTLRVAGDMVCAPVPVRGRPVNELMAEGADSVCTVAYEFAEGDAPDIGRPEDAVQMGRILAELHASMAALPPCRLPGMAAFPPLERLGHVADDLGVSIAGLTEVSLDHDGSRRQLLHGDFSSKNVRVAGTTWRVFDFDDCGYGPVELDVANSLYFVLFEATTGGDGERYRRFREGFVRGYRERSRVAVSDAALDRLITRRVLALASWLADPDTAPLGVRTASDEWRRTLEAFVQRYLGSV